MESEVLSHLAEKSGTTYSWFRMPLTNLDTASYWHHIVFVRKLIQGFAQIAQLFELLVP